jgi:hypothetical protein
VKNRISAVLASMNVDKILQTMNQFGVAYLLIGGMNFMLRHEPILTFDVDLWIEDSDANHTRCEQALAALDAEWGESDATWELVAKKPAGWLTRQAVFSLHSPAGAIDIFRHVHGLGDWQSSSQRAVAESTASGTTYRGLSDSDMLQCQLSLDASLQKTSRIQKLQSRLKNTP